MTEHWCACGEDINGHEWQAAAKRHLDLATEYRLRAEQAEATIQRAREFREELAEWVGGSLSVERVLHDLDTALEGDSDG